MVFAKVVLDLPIEGPFDYLAPKELEAKIKLGVRCSVPFRNKKMIGFIVETSNKTSIKKVKFIHNIIDQAPLLDENMLMLTKKVSQYYFCSWGEAISAALPKSLRSSKAVELKPAPQAGPRAPTDLKNYITLIFALDRDMLWKAYLEKINENIHANRGVIFLTPQIQSAIEAHKILSNNIGKEIALLHSKQNINHSLLEWLKIKNNQVKIVVGTRLAVFAPVDNLGLIIVDNEADQSFKQDQVPHYNARDVAHMHAKLEKADLILGGFPASLESFYLAKKKKIKYVFIGRHEATDTAIIDMTKENFYRKKRSIFSLRLQNILSQAMQKKEKVVIFFNRKGFATFAMCPNCGKVMRCSRCNVNLVYHFRENRLLCHYCNYKIEPPQLCSNCNAGYIRYSGIGTEKIESEVSRLYPKAKIFIIGDDDKAIPEDYDILISTSSLIKRYPINFDLIVVVSIDNYLNRIDFRAAEKAFFVLAQLIALRPKKLVIQTMLPEHYCFKAIKDLDTDLFYKKEIAFRKQLDFPPFGHTAMIKIRGHDQDRVRNEAQSLFEKLNTVNKDKTIKIVSCTAGLPSKLRSNFYWQILIKFKHMSRFSSVIKDNLKDFRRWGIIVTTDIDPV